MCHLWFGREEGKRRSGRGRLTPAEPREMKSHRKADSSITYTKPIVTMARYRPLSRNAGRPTMIPTAADLARAPQGLDPADLKLLLYRHVMTCCAADAERSSSAAELIAPQATTTMSAL